MPKSQGPVTGDGSGQRLKVRSLVGLLPLAVVECPIEFPRMRFYQMWHGRQQASPAHKWLRGVLKDVAAATVGRP